MLNEYLRQLKGYIEGAFSRKTKLWPDISALYSKHQTADQINRYITYKLKKISIFVVMNQNKASIPPVCSAAESIKRKLYRNAVK